MFHPLFVESLRLRASQNARARGADRAAARKAARQIDSEDISDAVDAAKAVLGKSQDLAPYAAADDTSPGFLQRLLDALDKFAQSDFGKLVIQILTQLLMGLMVA